MKSKLKRLFPKKFKRRFFSPVYHQKKNAEAYAERHSFVVEQLKKYDLSYDLTKFKHVLVVSVDCLRKDHLSVYGYERNTSPFLKGLIPNSLVFNNCFSAAPWTFPSVVSLFSGLFPHNHGATYNDKIADFRYSSPPAKPRAEITFLPEVLEGFGFSTLFVNAIATASLSLNGVFKDFEYVPFGADRVFKSYLGWFKDHKDEKTFSYLHLEDLHTPFVKKSSSVFGRLNSKEFFGWEVFDDLESEKFKNFKKSKLLLYDNRINFIDNQIRKLFSFLEKNNFLKDFLIVITADHGDQFWDHYDLEKDNFLHPRERPGFDHGQNLWNELLNIPLMIYGIEKKGFSDDVVSNVDLMPTLLDLCGVRHDFRLDGVNFLKDKREYTIGEGIAYGYEKKAIIKLPYKLLYSEGDNVKWLFDLEKDPNEQNPINEGPILDELMCLIPNNNSSGENVEIDKQMKERLEELGYFS